MPRTAQELRQPVRRFERHTIADAHLRVRASLADGSLLEFSEYIVFHHP